MAGKTGADAISIAMHAVCRVVTKYRDKLDRVIDAAETAGSITSAQATDAHLFVSAANTTCLIWERIAAFNSITP